MRALRYLGLIIALTLFALIAYGAKGYLDATADAQKLRERADALLSAGRGGADLGADRLAALLRVQDPAFNDHKGVDFKSAGAGATTISQSTAKRLGFEKFTPGIAKIRQTGYAIGLERTLSKSQILALWLDTLEVGRGPDGWMTGFFTASEAIFAAPPSDISDADFLKLIAVLIAPAKFDLREDTPDLMERTRRISRLITEECAPLDHGDVWLEGCRSDAGL